MKRKVLSIFGSFLILVFSILSLYHLQIFAKKMLKPIVKIEDITKRRIEDIPLNNEEILETTTSWKSDLAVPFRIIQVPVICGPKERLDPKNNVCKRVI